MHKLTLSSPIGNIVAVDLITTRHRDGAHGSVSFDALDATDQVVGQPARGSLLASAPSVPPTAAEYLAAVTAALSPA